MRLQIFSDDLTLYDSASIQYLATSIVLTEQENTTNTLEFTLPANNPNVGKINKLSSYITLYQDDVLKFEGRCLYYDDDILNNRTFNCEGSLSYLLDSIQRPAEYHDTTIRAYLIDKIQKHNAQVEEVKQFMVGEVTVTNSTDNAYRIDNDYPNTLNNIQEKLVNRLGGRLVVRKTDSVRYIDYLGNYGPICEQTIEFKKNILDLSQRLSAENVITALIPLGANDEETGLPLTIKSVNDGLDYVYDKEAVSLFGWIFATKTWDDVTIANNLLSRGEEALQENVKAKWSITVNAVDLSMLGVDIESIEMGMLVPVISEPHGLNENFAVVKKVTNYLEPENSDITLDTILERNTDQVTSNNRQLAEIGPINTEYFMNIVNQQTSLITGGQGGNMQYGFNASNQPSELYFMDSPDKDTAVNVLRINMNGIGFSHNGINGPFDTAWTLDGVFNASYITAGILQGIRVMGSQINTYYTGEGGTDGNVTYLSQMSNHDNGLAVVSAIASLVDDGDSIEDLPRSSLLNDGLYGGGVWSLTAYRNSSSQEQTYIQGHVTYGDNSYGTGYISVFYGNGSAEYTGTLRIQANVIANSITNNSSISVKENVKRLEVNALDEIIKTDVFIYNMKKDEHKRQKIGFVVGEGYNCSDYIIEENEQEDLTGIDLYNALALSYKAIQELKEEIEELKREIKKLKGAN